MTPKKKIYNTIALVSYEIVQELGKNIEKDIATDEVIIEMGEMIRI